MKNFHGIIFAYSAAPELRELVTHRTAASMPIFGRYRVIDFALSSLMNAGIHDVGVIMQRDYQSLMDHVRNGKAWDMSRKEGGVRLLPPFGMPGYHSGNYFGTMEALNGVGDYIRDIPQKYVVLLLGSMCANTSAPARRSPPSAAPPPRPPHSTAISWARTALPSRPVSIARAMRRASTRWRATSSTRTCL